MEISQFLFLFVFRALCLQFSGHPLCEAFTGQSFARILFACRIEEHLYLGMEMWFWLQWSMRKSTINGNRAMVGMGDVKKFSMKKKDSDGQILIDKLNL